MKALHNFTRTVLLNIMLVSFFAAGNIAGQKSSIERSDLKKSFMLKHYVSGNTYSLEFMPAESEYYITSRNGKKIIHFPGYSLFTEAGSPILPEKDIFIELPAGSKPEVNLSVTTSNMIHAEPEISNPPGSKDNTIPHNKPPLQIKEEDHPLFHLKGFLTLGGKYCMHISVRQFEYDYHRIAVRENITFKIICRFTDNKPPLIISEKADGNMKDLILNFNTISGSSAGNNAREYTTGDWIDYSKTYLKIGTAKDGIYRIYGSRLEEMGIRLSDVNPNTFKLLLKGNELPLYVKTGSENSFTGKDYVEFFGSRNYGSKDYRLPSAYGKPYNEYLDPYTDTTYYWLSWGEKNGLRTGIISGNNSGAKDTIKYYEDFIHEEKDLWYDFPTRGGDIRAQEPAILENETWIWKALACADNVQPVSLAFNFQAEDIYPGLNGRILMKVQSAASGTDFKSHLISLRLNSLSHAIDSLYLDKYGVRLSAGSFSSSSLSEGLNTLKLISYPASSQVNKIMADWFEVIYPRHLIMKDDSLTMNYLSPVSPGLACFSIKCQKRPENPVIYRIDSISNYWRINDCLITPQGLFFNDTLRQGRKYIVIGENKILTPSVCIRKFPRLRDPSIQADYLLITHIKFMEEAKKYADFIRSEYHLNTRVINVEDIYNEFSYGFPIPESIRDFLKTAHSVWKEPLPMYLFLVGQTTYDFRGNMKKHHNAPAKPAYLPSYGVPVSDIWFTVWDTTGADIPQMNTGRLPAENPGELYNYMLKHKAFLSSGFDDWNKRFLFFSGGNYSDTLQISLFRQVNDHIFRNYVLKPPVSGFGDHFYKTASPVSAFGPYDHEQVISSIRKGALIISYLGHSATQTWDNGIVDPAQLDNDLKRHPLITDFGCSTARFAEPDITSFSELFVNKPVGPAIAYIGNSSLGFLSTSLAFPPLFYQTIFQDSVYNLGNAHRLAKLKLLQLFGSSPLYRVFALTNHLIGDPVISLPVPKKPDLNAYLSEYNPQSSLPDESMDSTQITFLLKNSGRTLADSFTISARQIYGGMIRSELKLKKFFSGFLDSLTLRIPVKNMPGIHRISLILDEEERIDEINETNNLYEIPISVSSVTLKSLLPYPVENRSEPLLHFLCPERGENFRDSIFVELNENSSFLNSVKYNLLPDSFYTRITIDKSWLQKRVWMKYGFSGKNEFSRIKSFICDTSDGYLLSDSTAFSTLKLQSLALNKNRLVLDTLRFHLSVLSAGFNDGKTALISLNSQNLIPENTIRGHHICLFDARSLKFIMHRVFDLHSSPSVTRQYMEFLDTLKNNFIIAIAVADEGSQNMTAQLKNKLKEFGSVLIDKIGFRDSWAFIGKRGALPSGVVERLSKSSKGRVSADSVFFLLPLAASFQTSLIGPADKWISIAKTDSLPGTSSSGFTAVGIRKDGLCDTLTQLVFSDSKAILDFIDPSVYPYIRIYGSLIKGLQDELPSLSRLEINYKPSAEICLIKNQEGISSDTILHGQNARFGFGIFNASLSTAKGFRIKAEVINNEYKRRLILDSLISSVPSFKSISFNMSYLSNQTDGLGNMALIITADTGNKISELFEDNNSLTIPFFIKPDTAISAINLSTLKVTFDQIEIMNGDYVSLNPQTEIFFNYPVWFKINDTSSLKIMIDNRTISISELTVKTDSIQRSIGICFSPRLTPGIHSIKIWGRNKPGSFSGNPDFTRFFTAGADFNILNLCNYPNPFSHKTDFTFTLTQLPDELSIRIYTVTGRKVREIAIPASELNVGFNNIGFDGKDSEGNLLANGVYFYKVILSRSGGRKTSAIEKLAIIR